jgi:cell division protease FtsH
VRVNKRLYRIVGIVVAILAAISLLVFTAEPDEATPPEIAFSEFLANVDEQRVDEVTIEGNRIRGGLGDGREFTTYAPAVTEALIADLHERGIAIQTGPESEESFWKQIAFAWLPILLIVGIFVFFIRRMQGGGGLLGRFGKSTARQFESRGPAATFEDVAGVEESKAELQEIIEFLREPAKFTRLGGRIPSGVLLVGPPGSRAPISSRCSSEWAPPACAISSDRPRRTRRASSSSTRSTPWGGSAARGSAVDTTSASRHSTSSWSSWTASRTTRA